MCDVLSTASAHQFLPGLHGELQHMLNDRGAIFDVNFPQVQRVVTAHADKTRLQQTVNHIQYRPTLLGLFKFSELCSAGILLSSRQTTFSCTVGTEENA